MSNAVYPSLPGLDWPVGRAVLAPPVDIRTTPAQREYRTRSALLPRYQYRLGYEFMRSGRLGAEMATLVGFYSAHGGPFDSWLFSDPDDNTATNAPIGVGDGVTRVFQALRAFGGFSEGVDAFNGTPVVRANGTATTAFTVSAGSGRITFNTAPAAGVVLTWTGGFYRRCRFTGERMAPEKFLADLWRISGVEFISVKA